VSLLVLSNIYEQHVFTIGLWLGLIMLNGMCNKDTKKFFLTHLLKLTLSILSLIINYNTVQMGIYTLKIYSLSSYFRKSIIFLGSLALRMLCSV